MVTKKISVGFLVLGGIYFLLFHSAPFPLSHDAVGFPPYHTIHSVFGVFLFLVAYSLWRKK